MRRPPRLERFPPTRDLTAASPAGTLWVPVPFVSLVSFVSFVSRVSFVAFALGVVAVAPASAAPSIEDGEFVRVRDTRFVVGDQPFAFVGANAAVTHSPAHRASLDAALDAVVADGLTVVRVWALGEAPADSPPWRRDYAFRIGPDGWLEASFEHLDRVLVEARRRSLRVIVVLANRWGDYGGFSELARWSGVAPSARDLSPAELVAFFECVPCAALHAEHVRRVVGRTNALSGVPYRDDPTILAWELVNEISATSAAGERALIAWVSEHARLVHELAPNHLVSAGHIGWRTLRDREVWRAVNALSSIDFADLHAYPRRDPRVRAPRDLHAWIDARVADARALGKPLVIGELGFALDQRDAARWLDVFLQRASRVGVAGVLPWIYRASGYTDPYAIHFDSPRHARAVRRVLRRNAERFAAAPSARVVPRAEAAPSLARCPGRPLLHRAWSDDVLVIDPARFAIARFEACGIHAPSEAPDEAHLWGAGEGFVEWRFVTPREGDVTLEVTLSSELPGLGGGGEADVGSLRVRLDGAVVDERALRPDDGRGRRERVALGVLAPGVHRLRFETVERPGRGLAVYAREPFVLVASPPP